MTAKKIADQQSSKRTLTLQNRKARAITISLVAILSVLLTMYFIRGWVRATVVSRTVSLFTAQDLEKTADIELAKLNKPLDSLGYASVQKTGPSCVEGMAQNFKEEVYCSYTFNAYGLTPKDDSGRQSMITKAKALQQLLKDNGWAGTYTDDSGYASLNLLVQNINHGIDYTPDAAYTKTIGNVSCMFDSNTAYSAPSAPAISSRFSCWRNVKIFGGVDLPRTPIAQPNYQ